MEFIKAAIETLNYKLQDERTTNPDASSVSIILTLGNRVIEAYITEDEVQVNIINAKNYTKFYENVCAYIEERITPWDDVKIEQETEWSLNGFRDHADYLRYKYAI